MKCKFNHNYSLELKKEKDSYIISLLDNSVLHKVNQIRWTGDGLTVIGETEVNIRLVKISWK